MYRRQLENALIGSFYSLFTETSLVCRYSDHQHATSSFPWRTHFRWERSQSRDFYSQSLSDFSVCLCLVCGWSASSTKLWSFTCLFCLPSRPYVRASVHPSIHPSIHPRLSVWLIINAVLFCFLFFSLHILHSVYSKSFKDSSREITLKIITKYLGVRAELRKTNKQTNKRWALKIGLLFSCRSWCNVFSGAIESSQPCGRNGQTCASYNPPTETGDLPSVSQDSLLMWRAGEQRMREKCFSRPSNSLTSSIPVNGAVIKLAPTRYYCWCL